jgi:hypothetical protein
LFVGDECMETESHTATDTVTINLRGYLSHEYRESQRTIVLPATDAATPRQVIKRLAIPLGAVGLLLVDRQQVSLDTPLQAGATLDVLPLLGGG